MQTQYPQPTLLHNSITEAQIYKWFQVQQSWQRLNFIMNLLYECHPLERRFLVTCAEDLVGGEDKKLQGMVKSVNHSCDYIRRKLNSKRSAYLKCYEEFQQAKRSQTASSHTSNTSNHQHSYRDAYTPPPDLQHTPAQPASNSNSPEVPSAAKIQSSTVVSFQ